VSAAVVVLVHGAWHDASTWDRVTPLLDDGGVAWRALDLPSVYPSPTLPQLADDIAAVTTLLDGIDSPVVLVGHSYGGMVISAAGHHPLVRHLVYLSAFAPDEGENVLDLGIGDPAPLTVEAVNFHDDGTMSIDPALAVATFYHDVEPAEADRRVSALRATTAAVFSAPRRTASLAGRAIDGGRLHRGSGHQRRPARADGRKNGRRRRAMGLES
jgi:pimeloyl-ACP methyl ester carboxylesterase